MDFLKLMIGWIVTLFVGVAGLILLYQMFVGKINLQRLISEENGDASMSRFQLLVFTFVISMSLFLVIVSKEPAQFPLTIPPEILALLGISGGSYLVSKGIQSSKEISKANIEVQGQASPPPVAPAQQAATPAPPAPQAAVLSSANPAPNPVYNQHEDEPAMG
ncbi:MAG: hypothetical protein HYS23_03505 [Geobacter sp.]|nr:hypothetical protein [Geobacter sp.]